MFFKDTGIFSPKVDSSENLVFTVKVKKDDYTEWMKRFIFDCYNQGQNVDWDAKWLSNTGEDLMIKLRGNLWSLMSIYCQENKLDLKEETEKLRAKYKVTSRLDMSRSQLEEAIGSYQAGLNY